MPEATEGAIRHREISHKRIGNEIQVGKLPDWLGMINGQFYPMVVRDSAVPEWGARCPLGACPIDAIRPFCSLREGFVIDSGRSVVLVREGLPMQNSPSTRLSLLARIRDAGDSDAWDQFVQIYAPLVYAFGRRHGLQDADAADLTQDVLRRVIEVAGGLEYDPRRGSFRGWLFTVTRNRLRDQWKRPHKVDPPTGETATLKLLAEKEAPLEDDSHWWDGEYERRLYEYAAGQVRRHVQPSTWEAFRLTALEGRGAQEVAGRLGMSVAAVYLAKGRIIRQLKELIRELTLE